MKPPFRNSVTFLFAVSLLLLGLSSSYRPTSDAPNLRPIQIRHPANSTCNHTIRLQVFKVPSMELWRSIDLIDWYPVVMTLSLDHRYLWLGCRYYHGSQYYLLRIDLLTGQRIGPVETPIDLFAAKILAHGSDAWILGEHNTYWIQSESLQVKMQFRWDLGSDLRNHLNAVPRCIFPVEMSPNGNKVAVAYYSGLMVHEFPGGTDIWGTNFQAHQQGSAFCWSKSGNHLLLANQQGIKILDAQTGSTVADNLPLPDLESRWDPNFVLGKDLASWDQLLDGSLRDLIRCIPSQGEWGGRRRIGPWILSVLGLHSPNYLFAREAKQGIPQWMISAPETLRNSDYAIGPHYMVCPESLIEVGGKNTLQNFPRFFRGEIHLSQQGSLSVWPAHHGKVMALDLSQDGQALASAGQDGCVKLWDTRDQRLIRIMEGIHDGFNRVAMNPDGSLIAAAMGIFETHGTWDGRGGGSLLWDAQTGHFLRQFKGSINFHPRKPWILLSLPGYLKGEDRQTRWVEGYTEVLDRHTFKPIRRIPMGHGLVCDPNGRWILILRNLHNFCDFDRVELLDARTLERQGSLPVTKTGFGDGRFLFSQDSRWLCWDSCMEADVTLNPHMIWDLENRQLLWSGKGAIPSRYTSHFPKVPKGALAFAFDEKSNIQAWSSLETK